MRVLVTGGSGVLGRATIPRLAEAGHEVLAPRRAHLDLFDPPAIRRAVSAVEAVMHLATRIPPPASRTRDSSRQPAGVRGCKHGTLAASVGLRLLAITEPIGDGV
ncbi:MAG TPA: NAD-dependent epimerase/dehydratase family protein [Burkholderiales bacterium]|nr:NAD-dependent epimerase/dehydratase family protein [Burkholderiales bacterium]